MAIDSIYILNATGGVVIEKHYRKPLSRDCLSAFFDAQLASDKVPPILAGAGDGFYLFTVQYEKLYFLAVCQSEVAPLGVLEMLHRVVDTFKTYFSKVTEKSLAKESVTCYHLLEEMLDNGFPLSTELNVLREMIQPPSLTSAIMNELTGKKRVKETIATGMLTNTSWRRAGARYTQNECFIDITEEVDAIVSRQGMPVLTDIRGIINCKCKLSGMPDLTLSFTNPRVMEDVALHPCIRIARWTNERVFSFVPPDGLFKLAEYTVAPGTAPLPIEVRSSVHYAPQGPGRIEVLVSTKATTGKQVEDTACIMQFPRAVNSVSVTPSSGSVQFDTVTKRLVWRVGKLAVGERPSLRGSVMLVSGEPVPDGEPSVQVKFRVPGMAASGLKVNRLDLHNEKYKPFKGVKYITTARNYQVRT
eukprot:UC1_evm1s2080